MELTKIFLTGCFCILFGSMVYYAYHTVKASHYTDPSEAKNRILPGVMYSLTVAMSPTKKETAYTHLPTYTAGILYHLGSFLSIFVVALHFFKFQIPEKIAFVGALFLFITSAAGLSILIKRFINKKLRSISNPDDFASNAIVTGFHVITAISLFSLDIHPVLFVYAGLLFLYIPLGKLKHTIFFFLARIQLGLFYGKRGIWPSKRRHQW